MPKVFISYSHTSDDYKKRVAEFASWLEKNGIECSYDAYLPSDDRWNVWAEDEINKADFILPIFNTHYLVSWGKLNWTDEEKRGKGAAVEATLIKDRFIENPGSTGNIIFVDWEEDHSQCRPKGYRGVDWHSINRENQCEKLFETLKGASPGSPPFDAPSPAEDWIVESPANTTEVQALEYQSQVIRRVEAFRERTRDSAIRCARQRIENIIGALTERFGATSSWLFLRKLEKGHNPQHSAFIEPGDVIEMTFTHNTGVDDLELKVASEKGNGIVAHVACSRRPYLSNYVKGDESREIVVDPYYTNTAESTLSEMAVPIIIDDADGNEHVVGVLNLEANKIRAFLEPQKGELFAAASELAPHILILKALEADPAAFGWHPDINGWTLDRLLHDFCHAVSSDDSGTDDPVHKDGLSHLPRPSCTIWYLDSETKELFVRGTARFDYEYLKQHRLSTESFCGHVVEKSHGAVGHGDPAKLDLFDRQGKARDMGMSYAFAGPIYRPDRADGAVGTVNLYFFKAELKLKEVDLSKDTEQTFPFDLVTKLADEVGKLISNCQQMREEVAAAYLRFRIVEDALPRLTDFEIARDVLLECLNAAACTIFGRDPQKPLLSCLSTTGLISREGQRVDIDQVTYDLGDDTTDGLTSYLGKYKESCFRRRSVADQSKPQLPVRPLNKFRELFSLSETEHRPFLGMSIDDSRIAEHPIGVIRLLRRSMSNPFVKSDELLVRRLASCLRGTFVRWRQRRDESATDSLVRCGARYPFMVPAVGTGSSRTKFEAVDRLGSTFPARAFWNRHQIDAVLLDLVTIFQNSDRQSNKRGAFIASLRIASEVQPGFSWSGHRIYAIHSSRSSEPANESYVKKHAEAKKSVGLTAIDYRHAVTFDPNTCQNFIKLPESDDVVSGVCMPVRSLSTSDVVWGILSLDFDDLEFTDWQSEHLEAVALAAKKLDFIGRDNCLIDEDEYAFDTWRDALECFVGKTLPKAGVEVANIQYGRYGKVELLDLPETAKQELKKKVKSPKKKLPFTGDDEIRQSANGGFKIPLWYGPFKTNLTLVGFLNGETLSQCQSDDSLSAKLSDLSHLWNRFASSPIGPGVQPLFSLSFSRIEGIGNDGLDIWQEHLTNAVHF